MLFALASTDFRLPRKIERARAEIPLAKVDDSTPGEV